MSNLKLNNDIFSSRSLSIHRRILVKNLLSLLYTINPRLEWTNENDAVDYQNGSENTTTPTTAATSTTECNSKIDSSINAGINNSNNSNNGTSNNGTSKNMDWIDEDEDNYDGGFVVVQLNKKDINQDTQKGTEDSKPKRRSWKNENSIGRETITPTTTPLENTRNQSPPAFRSISSPTNSPSITRCSPSVSFAFPAPPSSPPSSTSTPSTPSSRRLSSSSLPRPRSIELPQSLHNYLSTVFDVDWSVALSTSEDSLFTFAGSSSSPASSLPAASSSSTTSSLVSGSPLASNPNRRSRSSLSLSSTLWESETSSTVSNGGTVTSDSDARKNCSWQGTRKTTPETKTSDDINACTAPTPPEKDRAWLNGLKDTKPLPPIAPNVASVTKGKDAVEGRGIGVNNSSVKNNDIVKSKTSSNGSPTKPKASVTRKSTLVPGRRSSLQHSGQILMVPPPSRRVNKSENIAGIGSSPSYDMKSLGRYTDQNDVSPSSGSTMYNGNNTSRVGQEITDSPKPSFSQRKSTAQLPVRSPSIQRDSSGKVIDSSDSEFSSYLTQPIGSTGTLGSNPSTPQRPRRQTVSESEISEKQNSSSTLLQDEEPFYNVASMSPPSPIHSYPKNGSNKAGSHTPPQAPRHLSILSPPIPPAHHSPVLNDRGSSSRPPIRMSSVPITPVPTFPPLFSTQHEEPPALPPPSSSLQPPSFINIRSKSDDELKAWSYTTFRSTISLPVTPSSSLSSERPPLPKRANTSYNLRSASKSSPILTTASSETLFNQEIYQRQLLTVPAQYQPQQQQQQQSRSPSAATSQPHSIRQSYQNPPQHHHPQQQQQQQQQQPRQPVKGVKSLARSNTRDLDSSLSSLSDQSSTFESVKSKSLSGSGSIRWLGGKSILGLKIGQSGK
ncbi:hypothetical protein BGX20_002557 [Mortierella sp. AD010]|nr:hypothetical protein BGX20_002557 [Mortierella sp. AD010]